MSPPVDDTGARPAPGDRQLLVIDTATTRALVALGDPDGRLRAESSWVAGYRHGEELLPVVAALLDADGLVREDLGGLVVGTGPGAFTGLRVGIATVKALAHALRLPVAGVATAEALLAAARADGAGTPVLVQPAGPSDRVLTRPGAAPRILPGGEEPDLVPGETLVAVDLDGRAPDDAVRRGEAAHRGLG
ncbi:MAG TPA: tRNA (adenosine(37)-N6)-threonylcarbamoyltransferase complex dimerization subunit type 1 TsaB, partial [Candidatus Limnocylindrales bacterium]|nr:tRNA (adenosine(37)-N6)-threonylcarbamoyltransferase complex dimerization subunit type 1 TsaB [Candidatus Limnocylindrales bacterium]